MAEVTVTRDIAAPPAAVFELVTDLPRMGEWSPENQGGSWAGGATGPALGAKFVGENRNGSKSWKTTCTITEYDAPSTFAFDVTAGPFKISTWRYDISATDSGCTVVESTTEHRNWLARTLGNAVSGVSDRTETNRAGIEATLDALAAELEGS